MVFYALESGECPAPWPCSWSMDFREGQAPVPVSPSVPQDKASCSLTLAHFLYLEGRWALSTWDVIMLQDRPPHTLLSEEEEPGVQEAPGAQPAKV